MEFEHITLEKNNNIATITLSREKTMNTVSNGLVTDIYLALEEIESDRAIRALVITGGEKVFAAGGDINELKGLSTPVEAKRYLKNVSKCFNRIEAMEIPVIAAISGLAFGGGFELALACDFRIASEKAQFALPEINLGLMPGAGGTQRLPRIVGKSVALELICTGNPIKAQQALEYGILNRVVLVDELMEKAMKMAAALAAKPGFAMKMIKIAVNTGIEADLAFGIEYEARCFEMLFSTQDQKEGTAAFIEKRKPEFKGC